ncbi:MAG: tryptophan synthase subunit alpha [Sedimentisphaeraceae bacterium JB056]
MNRIDKKFKDLKEAGEKALVAFITAGDPCIEKSLDIICKAVESGVDVLELGVPFSDPTADGPTIQKASMRALEAGVNVSTVFEMVHAIRKRCGDSLPIILFSYYNPIHNYGVEQFCDDAINAGADGALIVDLSFEEKDEFESSCIDKDFKLIHLVAPTTKGKRLEDICKQGKGFIYMINRVGITGTGGVDKDSIKAGVERIKAYTDVPVCMGFGVSSPEDAATIAPFAEGVVVGSLFVRTIEENVNSKELANIVSEKVASLKKALR